jgi:hypothetical protein
MYITFFFFIVLFAYIVCIHVPRPAASRGNARLRAAHASNPRNIEQSESAHFGSLASLQDSATRVCACILEQFAATNMPIATS